jgi:hypothetical protein
MAVLPAKVDEEAKRTNEISMPLPFLDLLYEFDLLEAAFSPGPMPPCAKSLHKYQKTLYSHEPSFCVLIFRRRYRP